MMPPVQFGIPDDIAKWDIRFMGMAALISTWSKDPSTQVGAVIVRPDRTIVSTGFNGFPQAMVDHPGQYANRDEKYSRIVHAEMNALVFARELARGYTIYTYPFAPCERCVVHLLQAGIWRYVFPQPSEEATTRWGASFERTKQYIDECGGQFTEYQKDKISG